MTYSPAPVLEAASNKLIQSGYKQEEVIGALWDVRNQLENMYAISGAVRSCNACPLRAGCGHTPVAGMGPITAPLMIVGESPGEDDARLSAPFAGAAGQVLTIILNKFGIQRNQVYITNIVKCSSKESLSFEDTLNCNHHFVNELATVQPKVILSMGNIPLRILADDPDLKIGQVRGKKFNEQSAYAIPVIPTFNPGYLFHHEGPQLVSLKKQMWEDIKTALQEAKLI